MRFGLGKDRSKEFLIAKWPMPEKMKYSGVLHLFPFIECFQ